MAYLALEFLDAPHFNFVRYISESCANFQTLRMVRRNDSDVLVSWSEHVSLTTVL